VVEQLGIDLREIQTRKAFLEFGAEDEANLAELRAVLAADVDAVVDEFYSHLTRFPELRPFLSEPQTIVSLRRTQREYLLSLGRDHGEPSYWEGRLRIGLAHERVGLPQKWYLGAYVKLFELVARRLTARHAREAPKLAGLLTTLQKVFTLDFVLAAEAYYQVIIARQQVLLQELREADRLLREASRRDDLTGLSNRVFLMECLRAEVERSRRFGRPFSLLFLDLDHFKDVNDRHGHAFGDLVLRTIARAVREQLRPADILGRFGGEEFLVGLVETDEAAATVVAERLRRAVARTHVESGPAHASLTLSIGVANLGPDVQSLDALIERADRALYQAKEGGRNQVRVHRA
jgi:diguanylate cyclase (GGDEF)-like protein